MLLTAQLLDQANVSIEYDCYPSLSTSLPMTIKDMDGNVIIPLFPVRSGIDQNIYPKVCAIKYGPSLTSRSESCEHEYKG